VKPQPEPGNPRVSPRLKGIGDALGLDFTGKSGILPNPTICHALMEYAKEVGGGPKQDEVQEYMFKAYFTDGPPDGLLKPEFVVKIAGLAGLDVKKAEEYMMDEKNQQAVIDTAAAWREKGVKVSPTFFMNGKEIFSGYQEPDKFIKAFEEVTKA